jgi:flagellar basal body rod protein FlgC
VPEEMVDMLGAARAYQANLTAIGLIRDTLQRALELAK